MFGQINKENNLMAKKENVVKTVEWFSQGQMLIKFVDEEDSIFLSEKVIEASDFDKYPIAKNGGDVVEVGTKVIDGEEKVSYLRKQSKFAKKTKATTKKKNPSTNPDDAPDDSVKEAPADSSDGEVKTIKIISVRTDRTALKYVGENEWPKIKESIQDNPLFKSKNVVDVKIVDGVITAVKASDMAQSSSKEQASENKEPTKSAYTSVKGTNSSIEGQVAVKEAGTIIR